MCRTVPTPAPLIRTTVLFMREPSSSAMLSFFSVCGDPSRVQSTGVRISMQFNSEHRNWTTPWLVFQFYAFVVVVVE